MAVHGTVHLLRALIYRFGRGEKKLHISRRGTYDRHIFCRDYK
jgi:hypothetical protein